MLLENKHLGNGDYFVIVKTLNLEISRWHLADYVKELCLSACRTCSTITSPLSTNVIIVFWRCCCCRCCRLLKVPQTPNPDVISGFYSRAKLAQTERDSFVFLQNAFVVNWFWM